MIDQHFACVGGQKLELAADLCRGRRIVRDDVKHIVVEAHPPGAERATFEPGGVAVTVPASDLRDRIPHHGKRFSLRAVGFLQKGGDARPVALRRDMFAALGKDDLRLGPQGHFHGGGARLGRGQKRQPVTQENQHGATIARAINPASRR